VKLYDAIFTVMQLQETQKQCSVLKSILDEGYNEKDEVREQTIAVVFLWYVKSPPSSLDSWSTGPCWAEGMVPSVVILLIRLNGTHGILF
jgi:hypothetical protein